MARSGVAPRTATYALIGVGGVGALTTKGTTRYASFGVAAAGAGQLTLSLLANQIGSGSSTPREGLPPARSNELLSAYEDAQRAMTEDEEEFDFDMAAA